MQRKNIRAVQVGLAACISFGLACSANAATAHSSSNKYFDAAGNLVGQNVLLCDNVTRHAGTVGTPYFISEETNCSPAKNPPPLITEDPDDTGGAFPGTAVNSWILPPTITIAEACVVAQCAGKGEVEVQEIQNQGWTWLPGLD